LKVGTFRQWLSEQETRSDLVGWAARWWKETTPGKISSPTGIIRRLEMFADEAEPGSDVANNHKKAAAGIRAAHAEWRQATGGIPPLAAVPEGLDPPPGIADAPNAPGVIPKAPEAAMPIATVSVANPEPERPEDTLHRIEAKLDRLADMMTVLIRQNAEMIGSGAVVHEPGPQEWATMFAMADHRPEG
jgi:hypothetical protein